MVCYQSTYLELMNLAPGEQKRGIKRKETLKETFKIKQTCWGKRQEKETFQWNEMRSFPALMIL